MSEREALEWVSTDIECAETPEAALWALREKLVAAPEGEKR